MDIDLKNPKVVHWLLLAVVILVAGPVYFLTTVLPFTHASRANEIAELEARHEALSRDLEKARLLVRNLERVEREYEILNQQWQVAQTLLPENNEMPALLRKVTAAGQQSGVEFEVFRPQLPLQQGFYADNPIEVKVQGGYHQTGVFLSRLANLNRIVNVSNLVMTGKDENDKKKDKKPFNVETALTITAYTLGAGGVPPLPDTETKQLAVADPAKPHGTASP